MLSDKYNYTLNGIEHEIVLNNSIIIEKEPLHDKILISNKYIIKYINDFLDYHSIEYFLTGQSLLGIYVFKGINIFNSLLEICISENHFYKLKKLENSIKEDGFTITFTDIYAKISSYFIDDINTSIYIYPIESNIRNIDTNVENDVLKYKTIDGKIISHHFYDIYSIKKTNFEEFSISIPNKIEKVLQTHNFDINFIVFTNKKKIKKNTIIEELPKKSFHSIVRDNFENFISTFL
jgi:hypothetical protein